MAYSKRNYYKRIIDVQNLTLERQAIDAGTTIEEIYHLFVKPRWQISRRTYSNYLAVNAKKLLKDMDKKDKEANAKQTKMF